MRAPQKDRLQSEADMARAEKLREQANLRHDLKYGFQYERITWRSAYEIASPKLDPESIWSHHRRLEEARARTMTPIESL